jgi:hopanoid biosynthesis associated protein HpnK
MVGAPAAADAVARAKRLPGLAVGLHLVLVDGRPLVAEPGRGLVRADGEFDRNLGRTALRMALRPSVRAQLVREIRAQFAAFGATGLTLDHVNAHKHMHLHPTIARLIVAIGSDYGMRAVRVPHESLAPLRRAFPDERLPPTLYRPWVKALRRRLVRAGLATNDHLFGIAWSGGMVEDRWLRLLPHLPDGVSEIYCHPATEAVGQSGHGYRHREELAALLSAGLRQRIAELGISITRYGDLR